MKLKRLFIFLLIILLLALLSIFWPKLTGHSIANSSAEYPKEPAFVTRIIDGDTVEINTTEKIRLLGINTPEKGKPFSGEAKNFLIKEIENKSVELLRDKEDTDRYGRKLRYIFYNNQFINAEIIQEGLATTFMLDELKYKDKLTNAEKFARENEMNLWKKSIDICAACIKLIKLDSKEDFFIIENDCNQICNLTGWLVKDDANHFFEILNLNSEENKTYPSKQKIWNNDHDRFFMRDGKGDLVVFYEY